MFRVRCELEEILYAYQPVLGDLLGFTKNGADNVFCICFSRNLPTVHL